MTPGYVLKCDECDAAVVGAFYVDDYVSAALHDHLRRAHGSTNPAPYDRHSFRAVMRHFTLNREAPPRIEVRARDHARHVRAA